MVRLLLHFLWSFPWRFPLERKAKTTTSKSGRKRKSLNPFDTTEDTNLYQFLSSFLHFTRKHFVWKNIRNLMYASRHADWILLRGMAAEYLSESPG
jgi:hypothetical protein